MPHGRFTRPGISGEQPMNFAAGGADVNPPLSGFVCFWIPHMEHQLVTKDEKVKLERDLKAMIDRRPVISKAIAEAREKGDLKENADYHAARDEYALNESHIKHMELRLKAVTVVDTSAVPADMVFLGSLVKLKDLDTGDFEMVRIVGEVGKIDGDSDIMEVSARSPLGEALMRARVGEKINVNVPRGTLRYEIIELM
jgi:transcription elongation factor GreA